MLSKLLLDRRMTEAACVRKPPRSRAPGEQFPRAYGRPPHQHMACRPCLKFACGFFSADRPCRGRRALKRAR
jgi:hypothetical protein